MFAARTDAPVERIEALFACETGYPTPKVDVRAAVFDDDDRILMVRETSDGGRWTLPGGWADVNRTSAQSAATEALEESGSRSSR
jgi:ADP-ribose pyrophosphatase YjhB (NUDIX family)